MCGAAEHLVPLYLTGKRRIPEMESEAFHSHRAFLLKEELVANAHHAFADPPISASVMS